MKCVSMSGFKCYIQLKSAPEKHRAGLQNSAEKVAEQLFCLVFFSVCFFSTLKLLCSLLLRHSSAEVQVCTQRQSVVFDPELNGFHCQKICRG